MRGFRTALVIAAAIFAAHLIPAGLFAAFMTLPEWVRNLTAVAALITLPVITVRALFWIYVQATQEGNK